MALQSKSLILYGIEITANNRSIDFVAVSGGPVKMASLKIGNYSLTDLLVEIARAMNAADTTNTYTASAVRTTNGGLENRVTISTTGSYLSLLFATGPRVASSLATTIGFTATDRTGATTYTGTASAGTRLVPEYIAYSYLGPEMMRSIFGAKTISARGDKEVITFNIQKFFQMEFRYEPEAKIKTEWMEFMTWAIQQKPLEFTPEISSPTLFYNCTLETTAADGNGMGYKMDEMLPDFPFNYKTGTLKFRQKV